MTQIEKIKAEIERQISAHDKVDHLEALEVGKAWNRGHRQSLEQLLAFINSLPEEQSSEEKPTCKTCGFYENDCPFIRGKFMPYPNIVCKDYTPKAIMD